MKKVYICSNENKLYIGKWTSKIGNVVFDYVNTIAIVSSCRTGSVFLAIYQASEVLISIIFNLIGGVIADGSNKKRLLIYTDIFSGIVSLILSFFVESSYIVVLIIIANIILAIISAYNSPIYRSIIREMVYKEKIGKYNAISNAGYQIAAVISPLLALYFVNRFNSRVALNFNACTFFVSAMMEIMLKPINSNPEKIMEKKFIQNLFNGIKYLVSQKNIFLLIVFASIINFFLAGYNLGVPNTSIFLGDISRYIYTYILIVEAIGGILGSYLSVKLKNKQSTHSILVLVGLSLCLIPKFSQFNSIFICLVPFFIATSAMSIFNVNFMTAIQTQISQEYLGRVFGIIFASSAILMPIGSFLFTYIINRYEIFEFLFVGVGVLLVNALFYIIERISCKKND